MLLFLAALLILGNLVGLFIIAVAPAPEGYEDESGFHYQVWANDRAESLDVSCVWTTPHGAFLP